MFTPARSGSAHGCSEHFLRGSIRVYTSAGPRAISLCRSPISRHWVFDLEYWPISAPYIPAGPAEESLRERSLLGASSGPSAEAQRTLGGVNSTTHFLQTDPLRSPRAGSAHFPVLMKMPLKGSFSTPKIVLVLVDEKKYTKRWCSILRMSKKEVKTANPCRPLEIDVNVSERPGLLLVWNHVVLPTITMTVCQFWWYSFQHATYNNRSSTRFNSWTLTFHYLYEWYSQSL